MSIFGEALGAIGGILGEDGPQRAGNLMSQVLAEAGGAQGILDRADQAGLGDKVRSWIGSGENWPISPQEVTQIFPPDQLDAWASRHGVPAETVGPLLAHLLPHAVDQATPDGSAAAQE